MSLQRSLAGSWQFQVDPDGTLQVAALMPDREIHVPLPWQAAFPELASYSGYAWYRYTLDLETAWLDGELLLTFGAVDYWCEVFVNRQRVGEHEGGYTPFTFPIRAFVQTGHNEITVRVYDPAQSAITVSRWLEEDQSTKQFTAPKPASNQLFDANEVPHGKQEWYLNVGGIWQDVTLSAVPTAHLDTVHITPDRHNGAVDVRMILGGQVTNGVLHVAVDSVEAQIPLVAGQNEYTLQLTVAQPKLWTPETPNLYTAQVTLTGGRTEDTRSVRFGFREISTHEGRLLLNGSPIFLLSALDQDLYPDTIYTVPSDDYLRDQFQKAKRLGLNCLRCHIKPPDPRYLDLADEIGLLIWEEIPSWRTFVQRPTRHPEQLALTSVIKARAEATLLEMITRDWNHPSLIAWTIVNEDWGTSLALSAPDRAWVATMYDHCKALDPTRLVIDNSACGASWGRNLHVKSDLDDFHVYTNIPDQAAHFTEFIEQFNLRPLWTFSTEGDAQRTGGEPLIISELGNWGLPSLRSLSKPDGTEPDWFELGPWWSGWEGEPGWPQGIAERFNALGLNAIWQDYEAFAVATQWHQFAAMKFQIEAMRRQPNVVGYVLTEFTDAYWESNGLLDFYRNPKAYFEAFGAINAPDVIVPQVVEYASWDDQAYRVRLHAARYSADSTDSTANWTGARLSWTLDEESKESAELSIAPLTTGSVEVLGVQRIALPQVEQARTLSIHFTVRNAHGDALAKNTSDVFVLPASARQAAYQAELAVLMHQDDPFAAVPADEATTHSFGLSLREFGYRTQSRQITPETQLLVTDYPTAESLQWLRNGGRMLYLSRGPGPFFWRQGRGGVYGGSWITSYNWLRPGIHTRLGTISNPLGMPFMNVAPTGVILGLPVDQADMQGDFLAGQITGWAHHPALHTVQFRYGRGRVIMTTYNLVETLTGHVADPVGVALFHDLVDYLASEACQPTLTANF